MNVYDALQAWTAYRKKLVNLDLVAESTWLNQDAIVRVWQGAVGDLELSGLRKSHIEIAVGELRQHRCPITVQCDLNVLRQALNWCVDEGTLAGRPRFPTVKLDDAEQPLPSDAAFLWALAAVPPHHAAALEFMMLMGLAPHELERLQVQDAGPRPGSFASLGQAPGGAPPPPLGISIGNRDDFKVKQAARRRWIPMHGRAMQIWSEATFGMPLSAHPFGKSGTVQRALARARLHNCVVPPGAEFVTPKMMRKWFSSKMASPGEDGRAPVPEHVLQRLLGHAPGSKITRRHYVRSSDQQMVDAMKGHCAPQ